MSKLRLAVTIQIRLQNVLKRAWKMFQRRPAMNSMQKWTNVIALK